MPRLARVGSVLCGLLTALCAFAGPAVASDFCVAPQAGCDGGQQPTLQAALDAALAAIGPDVVRLPQGTVEGPGRYDTSNPDNTVDVVGAGRDATVLTSNVPDYTLYVTRAGIVSDLTVRQPNPPVAGQFGVQINGTAERLDHVSTDNSFSLSVLGTARQLRVSGPATFRINGTLEDSRFDGSPVYTGTSATVVRRVRSEGPFGLSGQNSSLAISSSLIVMTSPTGTVVSLLPSPVPDSQATFLLSNMTLVGAGGTGCTGFSVSGDNIYAAPNDDAVASATLASTIVRGCATSVRRDSGGGNRTANLTIFNSDLDLSPAAISETGAGTLVAGPGDGNIDADPLFLGLPGLGQLPRAGSPVIDRGLTTALSPQESATDLEGHPRVVDGDGDGGAKRDMGAFEYQRRAPAVFATATPTTAATGQAIAFTGSALEVDPGELVAGYRWIFDDGAFSGGSDATHAFSEPGRHVATLTATDSVGAVGRATTTVTVIAPGVRSLSLSPAAFRAAGRGPSVVAAQRRRAPVGTTVRLDLTVPAAVKLTVQRLAKGRRAGKRCVKPRTRNRRGKACTRYVPLRGSIARAAGAPTSFRFTGRLRGRALRPGRYRLAAQAGRAKPKHATFRILAAPRRGR
jgi:hypothetical protein